MKVLVTGGCGFIGSHIVAYYLKQGHQVNVIDNLSTGTLDNLHEFQGNDKLQFINADINKCALLEEQIKWADIIYHFAAVIGVYKVLADPLSVFTTNIIATQRILDAILKSGTKPRLIIASSSSVYGHGDSERLSEETDLIIKASSHPLSGYAVSKIACESMGMSYFRSANIPVTLVRLFNVIGPRQIGRYGMVVPRFIRQACLNHPVTIFGKGTQTRSFCDVRDVVEALSMIERNINLSGEIINVGNDSEISINDLARLILMKTKSRSKIEYVSYLDAYDTDLTDIQQRRPDLSKLFKNTKFKHKWTLDKSLDQLISLCHEKEIT